LVDINITKIGIRYQPQKYLYNIPIFHKISIFAIVAV